MSMEDRKGLIWVDGALVPWRDAKVHLLSYTFQHGAGVFEGVRAYSGDSGTSIFRLQDHTNRLLNSAKILSMPLRFTAKELNKAQIEVVAANGLKQCYIRPVVYYDGKTVGVSAVGNGVHVGIAAWEWEEYLGPGAGDAGIRIETSSFARNHSGTAMGKAKATGAYLNSMMAVMAARRQGYDDALLLDSQGCVAECTTSNLFMVQGTRLATPDRTAILEGITRDTVMVLARERGLTVEERRITRDELYCADELFVTGTAAELTPVVQIDGREIGNGKPGPATRMLQAAYFDVVRGRDATKLHWLTPVDFKARAKPARPAQNKKVEMAFG